MKLPYKRDYSAGNTILFALGLISCLFVSTPFGRVSMLDLASYFLAPIIFLIDCRNYSKTIKRILAFALLWLIGGIISDWYRDTPFQVAFKANAIIFNAFTMLVVAIRFLRMTPQAIVWFSVGNVISIVISFYYFQNGAYIGQAVLGGYQGQGNIQSFMVDKMVYPKYIKAVFLAVIMPLSVKKLIPWWMCIMGCFACGLALIVKAGARSVCLIYILSAVFMYLYVYAPRFLSNLAKNKVMAILCVVILAASANVAYMAAAKNGLLGEEGRRKYDDRKSGEVSFMDDRADLLINWPFLWRNPVFGAGAEFIDRWGYVDKSKYVSHYVNNDYRFPIHHEKLFGHSCIIGAWTQCGLLGLIFWAYALMLLYDFLAKRLFCLGNVAPFMAFIIIGLLWDICFSPYGLFRGQAMFFIAFAGLLKTPEFASWIGYFLQGNLNRGWRIRQQP